MLRNPTRSARTSVKKRRFGPLPREISTIGQGTWYIDQEDRASAIATLRRGLDLGMNHIDTAEMYGTGAAEELVGEAIVGRRDDVFLVCASTECLPVGDADGLREIACSPQDRPAGLLSAALARPAPAGGNVRGFGGASPRGQDPFLWRE
jgi:hypothetical protein